VGRTAQLIPVAVLYAVVLGIFFVFDLRQQRALFYLLFAVTITASVQLVGIFLVFASLIVPALAACAAERRYRLVIGYIVGMSGYVLGLIGSALWDVPTGAAIVCALAMIAPLAVALISSPVRIFGVLAISFGVGVSMFGCASNDECIRRYLSEPRAKWCHAERTMKGERYERLEPAR